MEAAKHLPRELARAKGMLKRVGVLRRIASQRWLRAQNGLEGKTSRDSHGDQRQDVTGVHNLYARRASVPESYIRDHVASGLCIANLRYSRDAGPDAEPSRVAPGASRIFRGNRQGRRPADPRRTERRGHMRGRLLFTGLRGTPGRFSRTGGASMARHPR